MLNSRTLTDILTNSSDGNLCKRWFLMTENGTLLAYTQPAEIRDLRKQAALAALSWQEHADPAAKSTVETRDVINNIVARTLHTLILESETSNSIVRSVQPQLLLVLEGSAPPRKPDFEPRITSERLESSSSQDRNGGASPGLDQSISSRVDSMQNMSSTNILALQRQRMEILSAALIETFDQTSFKMPEQGSSKIL